MPKKILLALVFFLFCFCTEGYARSQNASSSSSWSKRNYEKSGEIKPKNLLLFGIGMARPVGNLIEEGGVLDLQAGKIGGHIGLEYLNFLKENFALGVEVGTTVLTGNTVYYPNGSIETKTNNLYGMLSGRLYLNNESKNLIYIPFGVGASETEAVLRVSFPSYGSLSERASDIAPIGYIGLGVELKRTQDDFVSLEILYHITKPKFSGSAYKVNATYSYVSVMLKSGGFF